MGNTVAKVVTSSAGTCALKTDGTLWCWGGNSDGQVANGTTADPVWLPEQVTALGNTVVDVAAGGFHNCALKADGTLWCWGEDIYGQIGDGSSSGNRLLPVQVTTLGAAVAGVSCGWFNTCAVKTDGTLWCWGSNYSGEIGDGTTTPRPLPVQVTALGNTVASVSVGDGHTCAVASDGTASCWGDNTQGELGLGTTGGSVATPTVVAALGSSVAAISCGWDATCAVKKDGSLWCWGWNKYGQLGDGNVQSEPLPVEVGTSVVAVSVGAECACALTSPGWVWCWGSNSYVQIGDGTDLLYQTHPVRLSLGVCASDPCNNGVKDPGETDVDCGGSCLAYGLGCAEGKACGANADCASGDCFAGVCVSCRDRVKDGTETDIDCGGSICPKCWGGQTCLVGTDCTLGVCTANGTCACHPSGGSCNTGGDCCPGSVCNGFQCL
jgi:alpha-tubulin suppressor-like RCC1 family protein